MDWALYKVGPCGAMKRVADGWHECLTVLEVAKEHRGMQVFTLVRGKDSYRLTIKSGEIRRSEEVIPCR